MMVYNSLLCLELPSLPTILHILKKTYSFETEKRPKATKSDHNISMYDSMTQISDHNLTK